MSALNDTCPSAAFGMTAIRPRPHGLPCPTAFATQAAAFPHTTNSFAWACSPPCTEPHLSCLLPLIPSSSGRVTLKWYSR